MKDTRCPHCRRTDIETVVGAGRTTYENYYGHNKFTAYECRYCKIEFHRAHAPIAEHIIKKQKRHYRLTAIKDYIKYIYARLTPFLK